MINPLFLSITQKDSFKNFFLLLSKRGAVCKGILMGKKLAQESDKIQKIREKIRKNYNDLDEKIDLQAIEKTKAAMYYWIASHASDRVFWKMKNVSLFDENQNSAPISRFVRKSLERLSQERVKEVIERKWKNRTVIHVKAKD